MTFYTKYSDEDLIEAYNSMLEYSGEPNNDLLTEIEIRGGMNSFLKKVAFKKECDKETAAVNLKVYALCKKEKSLEIIKGKISSSILPDAVLHTTIESAYSNYHANIYNITITKATVLRCLLAGCVTTLLGSIAWGYSLFASGGRVNYIMLPILCACIFITVQLAAGKTTKNTFVFMTAFFSIVASFVAGYYVASFLPL